MSKTEKGEVKAMIVRKFEGYGPGALRCDCGLPLKRTKADNLVHLHGQYSVKVHDRVMSMKADTAARVARGLVR
jgi:hypothetical protein